MQQSAAVCEGLRRDTIKIRPFDMVILANLLLYSVNSIEKGDRMSIVAYFGLIH